jgi:tricarballylate dehydrogenase
VPFSIVVNKDGERFYDEGEDVWPKRYAIWGRLVAAQPEQVAYAIIDSKSINEFMPSVFPPETADTIEELGEVLGLAGTRLRKTVEAFNAACRPGTFHPTELDGLATEDLEPPKTNWARPITDPPFYGYSLRPGVTFTYLGLKVDEEARVSGPAGRFDSIWACGEIMAGSILGEGYLAGFGMTIGTVFGRIAGQGAAAHVA